MRTPSLIRIPLVEDFRFVHEPRGLHGPETRTSDARAGALDQLTSRILLSHGGAFLLAGYRGVGKTTLVNTLIARVRTQMQAQQSKDQDIRLLHIPLTLARPVPPVKLMYRLISCLHEELSRQGLLARLPDRLARDLDLAMRRTSMSIALKDVASSENSGSVSVTTPGVLGFDGKIGLGGKRGRSKTQDSKYLAYDDVAAEQDLIRIARTLTSHKGVRLKKRSRWPFWQRRPRIRLKLFFVFDEMDKLEESTNAVDEILQTLKTLLTTSGITFLFVTGRDLYDKYRRDVSQGDSVYESVFTFVQYVPALWDGVAALCDPLIDDGGAGREATPTGTAYAAFRHYLTFRGRGIPRRILRGLHEFVRVEDGNKAYLDIRPEDLRRFRFFGDVEDALRDAEGELVESGLIEKEAHRTDQERLALRYLTDWILSRRRARFTIEEMITESRKISAKTAPTETAAPRVIRGLIEALVRHHLLERVEEASDTAKIVVIDGEITSETYRIPWPRLIELGHHRQDQDTPDVRAAGRDDIGLPSHYVVQKRLSAGAFGVVYDVRDLLLGRRVAVKVFPGDLSKEFREHLAREIKTLEGQNHPNIVGYITADLGADPPYLTMALVAGITLGDLLQSQKRLSWPVAVTVARAILSALAYLHERDILWGDGKPTNVMVSEAGKVTLIDFGAALEVGETSRTKTQTAIGTPRFMAPERIRGEKANPQADLFAVGGILFEMISGRPAFPGKSPTDVLRRVLAGEVEPLDGLDSPDNLTDVIKTALAPSPDDRFASASEMLNALPDGADAADLGALVRAGKQDEEAAEAVESEATIVLADDLDLEDIGGAEDATRTVRVPPDMPDDPFASSDGKTSPDQEAGSDLGDLNQDDDIDEDRAPPAPPMPAPSPPGPVPPEPPTSAPVPVPDDFLAGTPAVQHPDMPDAGAPETEGIEGDEEGDEQDGFVPMPRWMLTVEQGGMRHEIEIPDLGAGEFSIGRSISNDVVIEDVAASRYHAQIRMDAKGDLLVDAFNSTNGLYMNGRLIHGDEPLKEGDEIAIGSARLRLTRLA